MNQDIGLLTSAPGVGKKTAERLVLELREKIGESKSGGIDVSILSRTPAGEEAVRALVSLGYQRSRAEEVVRKVLQKETSLSVEEVIRRVLRRL